MVKKTLTIVGNSKAVILPAELIKKYKLDEIVIEEREDGILIRSAERESDFQNAVERLRNEKKAIYKKMETDANDPDTIKYYAKESNNFADV